ncbi:2'-hydroxyisoflavone reductase [Luteimonas sp. J16]|uniref:NAD-dependent epimerase/dehydratase family protein n=1 Tax=unclassified Luteimonas TaxID=2629088 RepID=UPI0011AD7D1B|nr:MULTISPECIES: NAD-dependent epimerase/dehydratase family protein [unclassified Luteimonas]TWG93157.1 2'-hydroxyisoflavone reductase [Luteimonas sp. J16]
MARIDLGTHSMRTTRRDLFKLGALAAASAALPGLAAASGSAPVERAKKPLDILILGGTGFTGPFQVQYALARGHRVTLFNRGRRPSPEWPGEVEQLSGDRNTGDLAALRGRRWDVCIDNPTTLPFWVRDAGQVLKDSVGQYIFISTISVYADGSRPGIGEDAPLAPYRGRDAMAETRETLVADIENLYGPLKALSEAEAHKQFGARTTIIRPGYIVGPRDDSDRFTYWPRRIAQGGEVLVPGDGRDPVQVIDGRDLAEWTIRMAENGTTGTFNACGPDYALSTDAMVHGCHAVTGGAARFTHVPADFLEQNGVDLPIWVSRTHPRYGGYGSVSNARAIAAGLTFRPLATTVADLLAWFDSLPAERQAAFGAGISREREAELLAAWRAQGA